MDRCFVIQPFDGAGYDNRYDDVLAPAIKAANLEPYRVDRDPSSVIPIDDIQQGIELSRICIADISEDNPNVWFELGYAIAARKDVVLICSKDRRSKFPFDVQHRTIIRYETSSPRDFEQLGAAIQSKISTLVKQESRLSQISAISSTADIEGLDGFEIAALVAIVEELHDHECGVNSYHIQTVMQKAGYLKVAASLGVRGLIRKGFVKDFQTEDYNGHEFTAYRETDLALSWLAENTDQIKLTNTPDPVTTPTPMSGDFDDDIPF